MHRLRIVLDAGAEALYPEFDSFLMRRSIVRTDVYHFGKSAKLALNIIVGGRLGAEISAYGMGGAYAYQPSSLLNAWTTRAA